MKTSLSKFLADEEKIDTAPYPLPETHALPERLSFTVQLVRNERDLEKAVHIRHLAYQRHVPSLAQILRLPEAADHQFGSAVLLARSRLDDSPLGTLRIQSNRQAPLSVEQSVALPDWMAGRHLVEMSRLGVVNGMVGRVVKIALMKASYLYCMHHRVEWVIATGRSPLDRQYESMLFEDIHAAGEFIPMRHVGNIPHRVMSLGIPTLWDLWSKARHPMLDFFFHTHHPDIDIRDDAAIQKAEEIDAIPDILPVDKPRHTGTSDRLQ